MHTYYFKFFYGNRIIIFFNNKNEYISHVKFWQDPRGKGNYVRYCYKYMYDTSPIYDIFLCRIKPGTQHIKLKQELEEQIAEQRSLEWAKRLEQEKQNQMELDSVRGSDDIDDIDKIEAKLEEKEFIEEESSEEEVEEEIELEHVTEKPRKRNPLIADEAEESDCDEIDDVHGDENGESEDEADVDEEDTEDSSEESEDDQQAKPKKGRILKAFDDSDDEDSSKVDKNSSCDNEIKEDEVSNNVNKRTTSEIKETQGTVFTTA